MKSEKRQVRCRVLLDDQLNNEFRETRTVYTRANGEEFIRSMGHKYPLINGVYVVSIKRITGMKIDDVITAVKGAP